MATNGFINTWLYNPSAPGGLKSGINPGATPVETAVGTPSDAGSNPAASTKLKLKY